MILSAADTAAWVHDALPNLELLMQGSLGLLALGMPVVLCALLVFSVRRFRNELRNKRHRAEWMEEQIAGVDKTGKSMEDEIADVEQQQSSLRDQLSALASERRRVANIPLVELFYLDETRAAAESSWLVRVRRFVGENAAVGSVSGPLDRLWREGRFYIVFGKTAADALARAKRRFPSMRAYEVDQVMPLDDAQKRFIEAELTDGPVIVSIEDAVRDELPDEPEPGQGALPGFPARTQAG